MSIRYNFENKKILITGGARGIGLELTTEFLAAGAQVCVWDFSNESIAQASQKLASDQVTFAQVDVANFSSCEAAASALPFEIDVLINNAGITRDKSFPKMTSEDFESVIDTNLTGVFNVTKTLFGRFNPTSNHKRIINIASVVAHYGNFGQTNYVASKAGVIGMTKTWAREFARKGFTTNAVAPGFTLTPMVEAMPAQTRQAIEEKIPVGRFGQPKDIANACLFLASEEASYVNGAVLNVDGGLVF